MLNVELLGEGPFLAAALSIYPDGRILAVDSDANLAVRPFLLAVRPFLKGEWISVRVQADCAERKVTARVADDMVMTAKFVNPVEAIDRILFRTGERTAPASPKSDRPTQPTRFHIRNVRTDSW